MYIYTHIYITDSFLPTAETNVTLYNNHTPKKKKLPPERIKYLKAECEAGKNELGCPWLVGNGGKKIL